VRNRTQLAMWATRVGLQVHRSGATVEVQI
jgi:hypothetical protein